MSEGARIHQFTPRRAPGVAPTGGDGHPPGKEARVAVLEKIASSTEAMLAEIRTDLKLVREKQNDDYRELYKLGLATTLALGTFTTALASGLAYMLARGFHWW